ncbi:MAG: glutamyl-tRNA reductase [Saprospiraceae bacterium]
MKRELDTYQLLTVTHKTANLQKIGDYVVNVKDNEDLKEQLQFLKSTFGFDELLYVPTCNRVIYFFTGDVQISSDFIERFFTTINPDLSNDLNRIHNEVSYYFGEYAINHFYSVASSVDSLVIGERQILGQLREFYEQSEQMNLTGDSLRLMMRFAVTTAKRVYSQTRIGEKPISVVSLAIKKLLETQPSKQAKILLVGAGQTNSLVSKFLTKYQYENVVVFNRTVEKAEKLAQKFNNEFYSLSELENYQGGFDVMMVCTGATEAIITKDLYQKLVGSDTNEKTVIDLAIPNNVDKEVTEDFNMNYIEIDTLRALAAENMAFRGREVSKAKQIVIEEVNDFEGQFKQRQIEKAMRQIPVQIKEVKSRAMNQVFHKEIATLDDNTRELMERMLTYMEKKCISIPMTIAKDVMMSEKVA